MAILDDLMRVIPIVKDALGIDMQVCLGSRTECLGVWYADSFRLDTRVGVKFDPELSPADVKILSVMQSGKQVVDYLPAFVYGVPTRGILTPIYEDGEVVGILTCAISLEQEGSINEKMQSVASGIENASGDISEIVAGSESIAQSLGSLQEMTDAILRSIETTRGIVNEIQAAAKRANILSLNASIESARAGEAGKGFAVVAKQMSGFSKQSDESAKSIFEEVNKIAVALEGILERFDSIYDAATTQVASTQELTSVLTDVDSQTKELGEICQKLMGRD